MHQGFAELRRGGVMGGRGIVAVCVTVIRVVIWGGYRRRGDVLSWGFVQRVGWG